MDSIRVSEAPDPSSILGEATKSVPCLTASCRQGFWARLQNFLKMYFAYVLKSIEHEYFYKGHCKELENRLVQHNSGMTKSIKPYIPFTIVYFEKFETEKEAVGREKYFKSSAGRRFLR